jgi:23S rRNA (cytidine1920-2'-O)/16S rRNA (cytidine1409-2'-O)-methyltransferase
VVAVDVGRAQLHERLRADARVESLERTDIRALSLDRVGGCPFGLIVVDLAFISLRSVAAVVLGPLAAPGGDVLALIKPQFEAGRREVSAGRGVVRDPLVWAQTLESVYGAVAGHGAAMMGIMVSPLTGADGNVEFFAHLRAHQPEAGSAPPDFPAVALEASRRHGPGA